MSAAFYKGQRVRIVKSSLVDDTYRAGDEGTVQAVNDLRHNIHIGRVVVEVKLDGKRKSRPFFADELEANA